MVLTPVEDPPAFNGGLSSDDCAFFASAYPVVSPNIAVVARPVARIFADVAGPGRRARFAAGKDVCPPAETGGVGTRSGSFIISHHLFRRRDLHGRRRHDLRVRRRRDLHARHRHRHHHRRCNGRVAWQHLVLESHSPHL